MNRKLILFLISFLFIPAVFSYCYDSENFNSYTSFSDMQANGWYDAYSFTTAKVQIIDGALFLNESKSGQIMFLKKFFDFGNDKLNPASGTNRILAGNYTLEYNLTIKSWNAQYTDGISIGFGNYKNQYGTDISPFMIFTPTATKFRQASSTPLFNYFYDYTNNIEYNIKYIIDKNTTHTRMTLLINNEIKSQNLSDDLTRGFYEFGFGTGYGTGGVGGYMIDDIKLYDSNTPYDCDNITQDNCEYPKIFCDDFNYITPIADKWTVLNQDLSQNPSFSPTDYKLLWSGENPKSIGYSHNGFPVEYNYSEIGTVLSSYTAPVFSTEFELNINADDNYTDDIQYNTFDFDGRTCVSLIISNSSGVSQVSYIADNGSYMDITTLGHNVDNRIKLIFYFGDANKSYYFNTSVNYNFFKLIVNGLLLGDNLYFNDECEDLTSAYFIKYVWTPVTLENYYHYVGTDKNTANVDDYFTQIYTPVDTTTAGETGEDLSVVIDDFWSVFGLKSQRSKFMFGLFIIFFVTLATVGIMVKAGHISAGVVAVVDFVAMILLMFMGLMPVWIVICIAIISAGIGLLTVKGQAQ